MQLEYLDQILDWAQQQSLAGGSDLHGLLDLSRVGCVGHSRGGKLAALHFAGNLQQAPGHSLYMGLQIAGCPLKRQVANFG